MKINSQTEKFLVVAETLYRYTVSDSYTDKATITFDP